MTDIKTQAEHGDVRKLIVEEARKWIGTPYVHQATTRGAGTDCLGLIRGVWRSLVGSEPWTVPAYSRDWSEPSGEETLMESADLILTRRVAHDLAPGGIVLFRMSDRSVAKHLGIISSDLPHRKFIHAYTAYGVVESSLSNPWIKKIVGVYDMPEGRK